MTQRLNWTELNDSLGFLFIPPCSLISPWIFVVNDKNENVLIAQLCPTLCDPMDCSPVGSSIHGISQAKKQEWVAISFSTRMRKCSFNVLKLPFICRIALLESKWHSWQTSVCFYYVHRMINRWCTVFLIWDMGADVSKWPSVLWLLNPFFIQILPSL